MDEGRLILRGEEFQGAAALGDIELRLMKQIIFEQRNEHPVAVDDAEFIGVVADIGAFADGKPQISVTPGGGSGDSAPAAVGFLKAVENVEADRIGGSGEGFEEFVENPGGRGGRHGSG